MKNLITCMFTLFPPSNLYFSQGSQREKEFVDGFRSFKKIYDELLKDKFVVVLVENTAATLEEVPEVIRNEWSEEWFFMPTLKNDFGGQNKGAGIIENLMILDQMNLLNDFEWVIHFEPRLTLKNGDFFKIFLEEPSNLFTRAGENQYFTGLYAIKTQELREFVSAVDLNLMVQNKINFENMIFYFLKQRKVKEVDSVGCLWHDSYANVSRNV